MSLEVRDLTLGYKDGPKLLSGVSLIAPRGELVAMLGRNGVGKSTLLRSLSGVVRPMGGEVLLDGTSVFEFSAAELARKIAFVSTSSFAVAHLLVEDVVAMGRAPYTGWLGRLSPEDRCIVDESLEMVSMGSFATKAIDTLSDGERQRVMIARALAQDTPVMLLDEPTAFLDMPNRYQIAILLRDLAHRTQKSIIFSSHDLATAIELSDSMWVISQQDVACGAPEDLLLSGGLDIIFRGTPLRLDSGAVRLELPMTGTISINGGSDPLRQMVLRAAERCGFALSECSEASVQVEIGESGILRLDSVPYATIHDLAAALRQH